MNKSYRIIFCFLVLFMTFYCCVNITFAGDISPTPMVSPTPAISISPTPEISVSPTPEISISPTPEISVAPTPESILTPTLTPAVTPAVTPGEGSEATNRNVFDLVKPSIVYGKMIYTVGSFKKWTKVEILEFATGANGESGYFVRANGRQGWVSIGSVKISVTFVPDRNLLTNTELDLYVNKKGFSSSTKYLVWVDISRQQIYLFKGTKYHWTVERVMLCATGRNVYPTPRGIFRTRAKGLKFTTDYGVSGKYYTQFRGNYLIHSLPYVGNKVWDYTLGQKASHGCIRIATSNAKWFYQTIPRGTTIWIN